MYHIYACEAGRPPYLKDTAKTMAEAKKEALRIAKSVRPSWCTKRPTWCAGASMWHRLDDGTAAVGGYDCEDEYSAAIVYKVV